MPDINKIQVSEVELIKTAIEFYFDQFFTTVVARVESYDATKQEADLVPVTKVQVYDDNDKLVEDDLPKLVNVPVAFPRSGDWFMSYPVSVGDTMTVVIASRDFSDWRSTGHDSVAKDVRVNPFNGAIAIPNNIYASSKALTKVHASKLVVGKDTGARIYISDDQINIYEENAAQFVALAQKTFDEINAVRNTLNALVSTYNAHTHSGVTTGGGTTGVTTSPGTAPAAVNSVAAAKVKAT